MQKISTIARAINIPIQEWKGRCHEISALLLGHGFAKGKLRYGHYLGYVDVDGFFGENCHRPFQRHGWIEQDDGQVCDPTRWVFVNTRPFIYVGPGDEYDPGGNIWREMSLQPPPAHDAPGLGNWGNPCPLDLSIYPAHRAWLQCVLQLPDGVEPTLDQVFWVANLPMNHIGKSLIHGIYLAIIAAGHEALIPIDNYMYVMEG